MTDGDVGGAAVVVVMAKPTREPSYKLGHVCWHCSDPDSGPDVGLSLGLGGNRLLWVGEITKDAHSEGGSDVAALGDDTGWWLMIYPSRAPLAKFANVEAARYFMDQLEAVTNGR